MRLLSSFKAISDNWFLQTYCGAHLSSRECLKRLCNLLSIGHVLCRFSHQVLICLSQIIGTSFMHLTESLSYFAVVFEVFEISVPFKEQL